MCRRSDELRRSFGCDADAPAPVYRSTCPDCLGNRTDCLRCRGRGEVDVRRCPTSQTDDGARNLVRMHEWIQRGIMPVAGVGWMQMPGVTLALVDLVASEHAKILAAREQERR